MQPAEKIFVAVKEALYSMVNAMNARLDRFEEMLRTMMDAVCTQ